MKKFTYRIATKDDLQFTDEIEKQALPIINPYYRENYQIFTEEIPGDLIIAFDDDYPVGMGRYSFHPDGSMWLETVRVRPDYQRMGIGTGIYEKYLEVAKEQDIDLVRLYTEGFNEKSMALTTKMGFKIIQKYDYYSLAADAEGREADKADTHGFVVEKDLDKVMGVIETQPWIDLICMNNVFYEPSRANMAWFVERGMFYRDGDSLMLVGARHNRDSVAYIGYMAGDYQACVEAAISMNPGKTVSAGISKNNPNLGQYFSNFEKRYDLVVSEKRS